MNPRPTSLRQRLPRHLGLKAFAVVVALWLLAPVLVVIPISFAGERSFVFPPKTWSLQWWENLVADPAWLEAIWTSGKVAAIVVAVAVVFGTAAALGIDRSEFRGKGLVQGYLLAPIIVPIVVAGVGIYRVFLPWQLTGSDVGFAAAHIPLAIPLVIVAVSASLAGFDRQLELAAASLGASPLTTFWRVTMPQIAPGMVAGAVFAFITSFDEVVVALFLASPFKNTLPVQMYSSLVTIDPTIAAASTLLLTITTLAALISIVGRRERTEAVA